MKIQTLIQQLLAAGFKQADISRETGIPQARLSRWTHGKEPESAGDALLIAKLVEKVSRKRRK